MFPAKTKQRKKALSIFFNLNLFAKSLWKKKTISQKRTGERQRFDVFCKKEVLEYFHKIHKKTSMLESIIIKLHR